MNPSEEWLEEDGLGIIARGTVSGLRTRRHHALLLAATAVPAGRFVLVNGFDAWVETPSGRFEITSQRYAPDTTHPEGGRRVERFEATPWPRWIFRLEDDVRLAQEVFVPRGRPAVVLRWTLHGASRARLTLRPFLSGREDHALHHENSAFGFEPERAEGKLVWRPYPGVPPVVLLTRGVYRHDPRWYWNFQYDEERARGFDFKEDLASPGLFTWDLASGPATLVLSTDVSAKLDAEALREAEASRRSKPTA
jgi:predicted glycogen debranching enzyme